MTINKTSGQPGVFRWAPSALLVAGLVAGPCITLAQEQPAESAPSAAEPSAPEPAAPAAQQEGAEPAAGTQSESASPEAGAAEPPETLPPAEGEAAAPPADAPAESSPAGEPLTDPAPAAAETPVEGGPAAATPAAAATGDVADLGKVTVTGSHIKQVDIEGPSPLLVIDRETIDRSGATTVSELLRRLPQSYGNLTFDDKYGQGFAPGSSGISLRGLGQSRTLVLINGRRVANYGFALDNSESFVDLNSIPLAAVERVEVLKDGASAIYGSDAIAGVVNIIFRRDYKGTELGLGYGGTSNGDANETNLTAVTGHEWDKSSITFAFDYFNRSGVGRGDREFSKSADHTAKGGEDFTSLATPDANVFDATTFAPLEFNGTYDFNPVITLIPASERIGGTFNFSYDVAPTTSLFVDLLANRTETEYQFPPTPEFADFVVPAGQAFNPYPNDVFTLWRMVEWGNRENEVTTDNYGFVTGLEGLAGIFDWSAGINFTRSDTLFEGQNYVILSALTDAVNNNQANPFGTGNSPAVIAATKTSITRDAVSELYGADAKASADFGHTAVAFGVEWRHESLKDTPDALSAQGDVIGIGGTSTEGDRDVSAGFAEFDFRLHRTLEMQLAARYEDYSDFGDVLKPKIGLRYQPLNSVLLRASWGQGFRAPSLSELYIGQSLSFASVNDPATCALFGEPPDCQVETFVQFEGNPDLKPEDSESINIGALFEPIRALTIQFDYWRYNIENVISQDPQYILANEAAFPGRVIRGPFGELVAVDSTFFNLAEIKTDGLDFDIGYRWKMGGIGAFHVREIASHLLSYERKGFEGAQWEELEGTYRFPEWRSITSFGWAGLNHGAVLTMNFTDSYKDFVNPDLTVDSWLTFDVQYEFLGLRHFTFTAGVKNIADADPPFANEQEGYDYATHDPRGRFLYGRVKYEF